MNACTIIAKNYLAQARVLGESFAENHPDGNFVVLVIDGFEGYIDADALPFEIVDFGSIGLSEDDRNRMAASYNVLELSTAVKPWFLSTLLQRPGWDVVTYLDPDIRIFDDLTQIDELARRHGLVLTPHFTAPPPQDDLAPGEREILFSGAYNLGFVALRACPATDALLDWWSGHLLHECRVDPDEGLFVDQRWMDLAPGMFPDFKLLRDPGYNVAYWNLPTREVTHEVDRYFVDDAPLRFFHFSGFDPTQPWELSRHQNRIDLANDEVLSELCRSYAQDVIEAGYEAVKNWPYDWSLLPGGIRLDQHSRRVYRQAVAEGRIGGSLYSKSTASRFLSLLNEADKASAAGSGVTRYMGAIRESRPDLQAAFPDYGGADAARFREWIRSNQDTLEIPAELRPAPTPSVSLAADAGLNGSQPGINITGDFRSELGTSETARLMSAAIAQAGFPIARIHAPVGSKDMAAKLALLKEEQIPHPLNLICANADMIPEIAAVADPALFTDRYSIGLWFWEVGQFPDRWGRAFEPLDEVWVATEFVAEAIEPASPLRVTLVRHPVAPADPSEKGRTELGMPDGYCFLFVFDHRSVMKRKNPLGLIEAFGRAFEPGSGPHLVIKATGGAARPDDAVQLRAAVASRPDVHDRKLRLLRLIALFRGIRSDVGRGHVFRTARDCHRLLRQPRLHE
jgi:hypothetical protein